jgi:hypothetical protein
MASLEEAFMELTQDSVDYRGEGGFSADPALAPTYATADAGTKVSNQ